MPLKKKHNILVSQHSQNVRIDVFLSREIPDYSRSFFQKLIQQELVTVNSQPVKVSYKTEAGDKIQVFIPPPLETELQAEDIPLKILYEDYKLVYES